MARMICETKRFFLYGGLMLAMFYLMQDFGVADAIKRGVDSFYSEGLCDNTKFYCTQLTGSDKK